MGRIGVVPHILQGEDRTNIESDDEIDIIQQIIRLPGISVQGIYTHFACADSADKSSAEKQFEHFQAILKGLKARGIHIALRHASNSAALIDMPHTHLDMVRPGIAIYGLNPSDLVDTTSLDLRPAMTIKARIGQIKPVPAGFTVSYGSTWRAPASTVVATVPVGYADGYSRLLSSRGWMLVNGRRAPVIGRVCMDLTMLDVGHIPDVRPETEVVILGRQGNETITADEIAKELHTINYEVVSTLMSRVSRVYPRIPK
jgi:alanine racemase